MFDRFLGRLSKSILSLESPEIYSQRFGIFDLIGLSKPQPSGGFALNFYILLAIYLSEVRFERELLHVLCHYRNEIS